jgi:hypothetical protein
MTNGLGAGLSNWYKDFYVPDGVLGILAQRQSLKREARMDGQRAMRIDFPGASISAKTGDNEYGSPQR